MKNKERFYEIPFHINERLFNNFERYCRYKGQSRSQVLNHMVQAWLDHNKDVPYKKIGDERRYLDVSRKVPFDTRVQKSDGPTLEAFFVD